MHSSDAVEESKRAMQICNSCRYCEGFCAVFPAMERRRAFTSEDISYLANLCHNCRGCYYSCQYAPPHEFGVNLPKAFAKVRMESYAQYAWPQVFSRAFERNGVVVSLICALSIAVVLAGTTMHTGAGTWIQRSGPGAFYQVISFRVMTGIALITFGFALLSFAIGGVRFWRDIGGQKGTLQTKAVTRASVDILTLVNLGGGGEGCNDVDESFSTRRRRYHHALFYGFMFCFASTTVAAAYDHFFHWIAPYPLLSAPVVLGTIGGIAMVIGATGLFALKMVTDQTPSARDLLGADVALILLLGLSALSGLLLLSFRSTSGMALLLALHLGFILALFIVMPFSRFVHGIYRSAALLKNAIEERDTNRRVVD
ncbi:MAG: hypothetical protein JWN45_2791 [Acidobacteriaceae bacterium]|nr:hypothetical protein [Acidobacteriaceae bacterium]